MKILKKLGAALADGGVKPGVCGPRVRTVTACQGNEVCPSGCINTYELARSLMNITSEENFHISSSLA